MNTRSISGAARVICEAEGRANAVPATIAVALDAAGWLNTPDTAAELVRLRLLLNAQPATLTEDQTDALADAGNQALNDHYHDDLCHCSDWPESCASSGNYFAGSWDTAAFSIGMAAVIGLWESMRAPAEADELSRLRTRVAELEAERHVTNEALSDAAEALRAGRDRIAELETARRATFAEAAGVAQEIYRERDDEAGTGRAISGRLFALASVEDPHDSPLHHTYRLGHDLEFPHA